MKQIVFYIEGGSSKTEDIEFRQAFHQFFTEIAEHAKQRGFGFRTTLEGTRRAVYERFCEKLKSETDVFPVLLVDSEDPVTEPGKCWKHLRERKNDQWECPRGADDRHCHLMVQAMEAWFFADPETLTAYYGKDFHAKALPRRVNVEEIPKQDHLSCLEMATVKTQKERYHKTRHAPDILKRLDVRKVRKRAWHCDRIFTTLAEVIDAA